MVTALQVALLAPFTLAGGAKTALSYERFASLPFQEWAADFRPSHVKVIGIVELGAAAASAASLASDSNEVLAIGATVVMATVMAGAAATHLRRQEYPNLVGNLTWLAAALAVAWSRTHDYLA